jgi:hypothetical protein
MLKVVLVELVRLSSQLREMMQQELDSFFHTVVYLIAGLWAHALLYQYSHT